LNGAGTNNRAGRKECGEMNRKQAQSLEALFRQHLPERSSAYVHLGKEGFPNEIAVTPRGPGFDADVDAEPRRFTFYRRSDAVRILAALLDRAAKRLSAKIASFDQSAALAKQHMEAYAKTSQGLRAWLAQ
jgi:hypothetical protein